MTGSLGRELTLKAGAAAALSMTMLALSSHFFGGTAALLTTTLMFSMCSFSGGGGTSKQSNETLQQTCDNSGALPKGGKYWRNSLVALLGKNTKCRQTFSFFLF